MAHIVLYLKLIRYIFARLSLKKCVVNFDLISLLYLNSPLLETCFSRGHKLHKEKSLYCLISNREGLGTCL